MIAIIIGILITAFAIWVLWYGFKHFWQIFEVVFLLSIILFGYATMFFCIGIFGDKKQTKNTDVNECVIENTITEDTSTYILLKIDTIYYGRKCDFKGELNSGGQR